MSNLVYRMTAPWERLQERVSELPERDRRALVLLTLFLLVFMIGGGLFMAHKQAKKAERDASDARELLLWMRSQAPNLAIGPTNSQPLSDLLQSSAQAQGLTLTQNPMGEQISVQTSNTSFAVLGSWMSRLAAEGVQFSQLSLQEQPGGVIQLQATVKKSS